VSRLLVTGGSGYLGRQVAQAAARAGWDVTAAYRGHPFPAAPGLTPVRLDLCQGGAVAALIAELRPAAVIHTACSNRDAANVEAIEPAARHLALAARRYGSRLVHVSTDMVFDGDHAPYGDEAAPAPLTEYGRAKAAAETAVAALDPGAVIGRPSLIWSLDPLDRQTAWLVDGMRRGGRVTLFTDEIRCPVHAADLVAALLELAGRAAIAGPVNLGGVQALSRWDFGLRLLRALDLPRAPNVVPGTVAESGQLRPRDLSLEMDRARRLLQARLRAVDEVLAPAPDHRRGPRYCEG
jgi:dTDP-4-dehydrorhamnose reductase